MNNEYICDDRPIKMSDNIAKMSEEEFKIEFQKRFGNFTSETAKENVKEN